MSISPYPNIDIQNEKYEPIDGFIIKTPKYCFDNCNKSKCRKEYEDLKFEASSVSFKTCHKGFLICSFLIYDKKIVMHGVVDRENKEISRKKFGKRFLKENLVSKVDVENFAVAWNNLDKDYFKRINSITRNLISPYHDIKRLVGTIVANIELFARRSSPDKGLKDALMEIDERLKAIFYTSKLIDLYTSIVDAFSNPEILKSGTTRMRKVYGSFDKISKILFSKAHSKNVEIILNGNDFSEIPAYASLDLLPFILVDNAIKYSVQNYSVDIDFKKTNDFLDVIVSNTGCCIDESEFEKIFKKHVRGQFAYAFSTEGSGIGLFLAKVIANHHNATIEVKSTPLEYQLHGVKIAKNKFIVKFKL